MSVGKLGSKKRAATTTARIDKTLQKGLRIIEELSEAGRPLGVSEIAQSLNYTKSNAHRLLQSLCATGWVLRNPKLRTYDLSLRVWEVGVKRLSTLNLPQIGYPEAQRLARATEESVHIAMLEQGEVVFLETIDTPKPIRAYVPVGDRAPAYCVATGKVILAFMPEEDAGPLLTNLTRFTKQTITDRAQLQAEFAQIRRRGYAINRGEWQQDVHGLAAPIFAGTSRAIVGSIGLSGPANRFGQVSTKRFVPMIIEAAAKISVQLHGAPVLPPA